MAQSGDSRPEAPSPERVGELVESLASMMRQSALTELDVNFGEITVRLRRSASKTIADSEATAARTPEREHPRESTGHLITAPMIGTYYTAPNPGSPPFVTEGDEVFAGQTIGIIEAMKIMNEIAADRPGIVEEMLVGNGQPVEYGSPLIRLDTGRTGRR